jgi:hypothetical protein
MASFNPLASAKFRIIVLLMMLDILFFGLVNPTTSNSYVVILGCILIILSTYALVLIVTRLVAIFIPVSVATQKRFTLFVSLLLVFILLMQSIGQLSTRDLIAILPLLAVLYIYLTYVAKDKPQQP